MQYKFINNMGRIRSGDNTGTFFPKFKGLGLKLFSTRKQRNTSFQASIYRYEYSMSAKQYHETFASPTMNLEISMLLFFGSDFLNLRFLKKIKRFSNQISDIPALVMKGHLKIRRQLQCLEQSSFNTSMLLHVHFQLEH